MAAAQLRGRRALVTGGSSGIGRARGRALARRGAHVAIAARSAAALEVVLAEMRAAAADPAQRFAAVPCDVADAEQTRAAVDRAAEALGGLDLVVNNAGVALAKRFEETEPDELRHVLDVNFHGAVHVTRAALPHLRRAGGGDVCNVSSLAGLLAVYGYAAYAPSKFAVTAFSEVLRQELRPHGIRVSTCFPPDVDTPMLEAENRTKPAETKALAGNASLLSAESVADEMLDGIARGRATIIPGRSAKLVAWAARVAPGFFRWFVDRTIAATQR